jgi:TetR/AcrR family transcriptional repressor of uid operon
MSAVHDQTVAEKPRTLARRRQVLDAAALCFRRHGFHSCSMAQISAAAGMSVGHIYRYFTGKEAIIAAIVREDVDDILSDMAEFPMGAPDLRAALVERVEAGALKEMEPQQSVLMIEIRAEAARNPAIADLVREADAKISERLRPIIAAAVGRELDKTELDTRVEMFHLIFQGIALRAVVNPGMNRNALARRVRLTIEAVLA